MELIRLENIYKTYHIGEIDVPVLKGVSLSIQRGELIALMGASGSGKSTLMNILGLLDRPSSGQYWLDGVDVSQLPPDRRALVRTAKLGFVFQSFNLLSRTTAINNVLMPLDYSTSRPGASEALTRGHRLLTRVGLSDRVDHVPSQMSGGQQQRVAIARSLINEPALLLADEPTGNLDSRTSVEILEMFQQLNASGLTVILVTHDPKVATYAHRTIRVADGVIERDDGRTSAALPAPHLLCANPRIGNGHHAQRQTNGESWTDGPVEPIGVGNGDGGSAVATRTQAKPRSRVVAAPQTAEASEGGATESTADEPAKLVRLSASDRLSAVMPATLRTAFGALRRNLMRSALTTLGIIIGVGAVIAMVEISSGSRTALMKTMSSMGANVLIVNNGAAASGGVSWGSGTEETLTPDDATEMVRECPSVADAAPIVSAGGQVVYGNRNWVPMRITGSTPGYLVVRDWNEMDDGEMFTERDVLAANRVCVIGRTLARELFQGESPVGKDIRLKNVSLRVVGVLGRKGANMMGEDQDDIVLAPWTTIKFRISGTRTGSKAAVAAASGSNLEKVNSLKNPYPGTVTLYPVQSAVQQANTPQPVRFATVDVILVKGVTASRTKEAISEITALLHERHRIRDEQDDDFTIRDMAEIISAMSSMSRMMGGLLLIVAMISLAVGGVGIMNIMLVSVTERTREIGLRMAVGARSYHILRQFLIEAVVLCLFGGALGIALGRSASILVWYFMRWPVQASLPAIAAAFAVSAGVGIAFGFYPAWKASRLDPIEALRYE
jgi:macrolide transport system ATP-binding/permease protein